MRQRAGRLRRQLSAHSTAAPKRAPLPRHACFVAPLKAYSDGPLRIPSLTDEDAIHTTCSTLLGLVSSWRALNDMAARAAFGPPRAAQSADACECTALLALVYSPVRETKGGPGVEAWRTRGHNAGGRGRRTARARGPSLRSPCRLLPPPAPPTSSTAMQWPARRASGPGAVQGRPGSTRPLRRLSRAAATSGVCLLAYCDCLTGGGRWRAGTRPGRGREVRRRGSRARCRVAGPYLYCCSAAHPAYSLPTGPKRGRLAHASQKLPRPLAAAGPATTCLLQVPTGLQRPRPCAIRPGQRHQRQRHSRNNLFSTGIGAQGNSNATTRQTTRQTIRPPAASRPGRAPPPPAPPAAPPPPWPAAWPTPSETSPSARRRAWPAARRRRAGRRATCRPASRFFQRWSCRLGRYLCFSGGQSHETPSRATGRLLPQPPSAATTIDRPQPKPAQPSRQQRPCHQIRC
jgi:hypothetical protein